jgi:hypothetical protein
VSLAPIVLFVYARPEHTRQCLESLMANDLAAESELFIHADGPKKDAPGQILEKIAAVREVIRARPWCGRVHFIEPAENRTMPVALVETVTRIVNQFGKIIVLEDDLVVSKGFLKYMNDGLELYADRKEVFGVEGYLYPIRKRCPETFFLPFTATWGWGTWARAWSYFNPSAEALLSMISKGERYRFNLNNSYDIHGMLVKCTTGSWKYWDVRWYASVFVHKGMCLYPKKSLVRNIGHDNSGMHCLQDDGYLYQEIADGVQVAVQEIEENAGVRRSVIRFFWKKRFLNLMVRIKLALPWKA